MQLDDWIKSEIDSRWPGKKYSGAAEREFAPVWREIEPHAARRVRDLPYEERLALVMKMTSGHEGCIEHLYIDSEGLATLGVGTMVDRENASLLARAPLERDGREATAAERKADLDACRALFKRSASPPSASAYAAVTRCRISEADAFRFAGGLLDDFARKLFDPAYPHTYQHKEDCPDYPLLAWMVLVDMAFNLGNAGLNKFKNLNAAIKAAEWGTAAKESLVRGVSYLTLATRYALLQACDGFDPAAAPDPVADDDPAADPDVHIGPSGAEGVTVEKVLDVPTLSQGNPSNGDSVLWCGRTSAAMVYNYYQAALGKTELIVNSTSRGDLVYPDGKIAAGGYVLTEPLDRAKPGWQRKTLYATAGRQLPLDEAAVRAVMQPVIDSIDQNNPVVAYTALSKNEHKARHLVVFSGYREKDGALWIHVDDPSTMRFGAGQKGDFLGGHNVEILSEGVWQSTGSRYWLRASRLFESNDHSDRADDLWCDHHDRPGLAVFLNPSPTQDNPRVHTVRTARVSLPVDLGLGLAVTDATVLACHEHVEKTHVGGYYPLGTNTVWHGGVHLRGRAGSVVHAVADGEIVAARLPGDEDRAIGDYGSSNFILIKHQVRGSTLNGLAGPPRRVGFEVTAARNIRRSPTVAGDNRIGLLGVGDRLELLADQAVPADNYQWYKVKVTRSAQASLVGQTGFVAHSGAAFRNVYSSRGDAFEENRTYDWFSLYVHLEPLPLEADSADLADIPWLQTEVRVETTAAADDPCISGSVGQGGRNLRADVRTVQTLLNAAGNDCGVVDGLIGSKTIGAIRAFQAGFLSQPDGRIDVGGTTWRRLLAATAQGEGEQAIAVDAALLGALAGGDVVAVGRRVRAGEKLWLMGQHGSEGYRSHMLHFETFSAENLFPAWTEVVDDDTDFNMDCRKILALIEQDSGWFEDDEIVTAAEIKRFYQEDYDAAKLRHYVCKFVSEWGVDLDVAIERMKGRWFTWGLRERLEPYVFYKDIQAVAEVPKPFHYHYNPIALLEALSAESPMEARPSDPAVTNPEALDPPVVDPTRPDTETPGLGQMYFIQRAGKRVKHFCQADPAWGDRTLGSSASLRSAGCAVTALAMILEYYGRDTVTPGTLDGYLDTHGGYSGNAVIWATALKHEEAPGKPKLVYKERLNTGLSAVIDARIAANRPTLARVDYASDTDATYNHFVVIVGKDAAGRYIMNDPGTRYGDGTDDPDVDDIVQTTRRGGGGYRIVQVDIIDPVGEPDPPPVTADDPLPEDPDPPATSTDAYGGFVLQYGDNDAGKKWGGQVRSHSGALVAALQRDLVRLGHWISNPSDLVHKGMNVDGWFGGKVRGAVYLFQRENGLPETGKVDPATAEKIRTKLQGDTRRGSHSPRNAPGATFYQLPPSPHYARYGDIPTSSTGFIMDNWGTRAMIDCIQKAADEWARLGRGPFLVGDISLYDGGYFAPHSTHRDGQGADIAGGAWCDIRRANYNKEESLQLARIFAKHGAKRILFNCMYVVDHCPQVKSCQSHHHHYHLDVVDKPISQPKPSVECKGCHADVHRLCDHPNKRSRT